MSIRKPYLIFLGDAAEPVLAKTVFGVRDRAPQDCRAQWRLPECQVDLGLPDMEPAAAAAVGVRSLLIGIAPGGGRIPASWVPGLRSAITAGLDIVSGLHTRLEAVEGLAELAAKHKVQLIHPGYAGVTLGLVHGSQADALVLCHDPTRKHIAYHPHAPLPSLKLAATRYIEAAQLTNANVRLVGVSLNTSALSPTEREKALAQAAQELGVPSFDPLHTSTEAVLDLMLS